MIHFLYYQAMYEVIQFRNNLKLKKSKAGFRKKKVSNVQTVSTDRIDFIERHCPR